jgi:hypothetical protein
LNSECNNTGTNNFTVGLNGAKCTNSGTNTIAMCSGEGPARIINVGNRWAFH